MPLVPSVARRLLRFELEHLVADANVTHQQIAGWFGVTRPAVTAALACTSLLSRPALEVLLGRLDHPEWFPRLSGLLVAARRKPAQAEPATVTGPRDAELVVGLEAFAESITVFDPWLVPVQLQTHMYAAALTNLDNWAQNHTRHQRQAPLTDEYDPLALRWITSEHALHRRVGNPAVMGDQHALLAELGSLPHIHIHVIPASTELPPVGPFHLIYSTSTVAVEPRRLALHYAHDKHTVAHFEHLAADGTSPRTLDTGLCGVGQRSRCR